MSLRTRNRFRNRWGEDRPDVRFFRGRVIPPSPPRTRREALVRSRLLALNEKVARSRPSGLMETVVKRVRRTIAAKRIVRRAVVREFLAGRVSGVRREIICAHRKLRRVMVFASGFGGLRIPRDNRFTNDSKVRC